MTTEYFLGSSRVQEQDRLVLFHKGQIIVQGDNWLWSPEEVRIQISDGVALILVSPGASNLLVLELDSEKSIPADAEPVSLRSLLFKSDAAMATAGKANQVLEWYKAHRYCGYCGRPTMPAHGQLALRCMNCAQHVFPRINPCVIVLVLDGDKMLLARSSRYRTGFMSCLAGFIEVGESAEETVVREVKEESNLDVENIRYFKSQSWPFPSQLMLGFYADYKSGEIIPEEEEIEEADWFGVDDLPQVPSGAISVAGELIEHFVQQVRAKNQVKA